MSQRTEAKPCHALSILSSIIEGGPRPVGLGLPFIMLHNIQRPRHGLAPVLRDAYLCTLRRGSPSRPAWQFCAPRQPFALVCCQSHAGRAGDPGAQRTRSSSTKNLKLERTRKSELGHTKILSSRSQKLGFRAHKNSGKIGARPYKKV